MISEPPRINGPHDVTAINNKVMGNIRLLLEAQHIKLATTADHARSQGGI